MNSLELRTDITSIINSVKSKNLLEKIYSSINNIISAEKNDFWDKLSDEERAAIEEGIAQADRGEVVSHAELQKEIKKKFNL